MSPSRRKPVLVRPFISEHLSDPVIGDNARGRSWSDGLPRLMVEAEIFDSVFPSECEARKATGSEGDHGDHGDTDDHVAGTAGAAKDATADPASSAPLYELVRRRWYAAPPLWRVGPIVVSGLLLLASGAISLHEWRLAGDRGAEASDTQGVNRTPPLPPALPAPGATPDSVVGEQVHGKAIKATKPKPKPKTKPKSSKKPKATQAPAADRVTYRSWAGHGCPADDTSGYREYGRYWNGWAGWYTNHVGSNSDNGCASTYSSVPMSGSSWQDGNSRALWWWSVGKDSDRCSITVYIPGADHSIDVAGHPTTYRVLSDPDDWSSDYAGFEVDQTANHDRMVEVGTYEVRDGRIAVLMLDRGEDSTDDKYTYGYGSRYSARPHHAAGQMQITCRSS